MKNNNEHDLPEGRKRRDAGIEKVLKNEHPAVVAWSEAFDAAADTLIDSDQFFHAEHIRRVCGDPPIEAHCNIFGGKMAGVARKANRISSGQAERPSSHARGLRIYKGRKIEN